MIGDVRGSGGSDGEHVGNYNSAAWRSGKDAYDLIEWVAEQPWCDGNVGMIGISYFGSMQVLGAAERRRHLKAIFVTGGHFDFYETTLPRRHHVVHAARRRARAAAATPAACAVTGTEQAGLFARGVPGARRGAARGPRRRLAEPGPRAELPEDHEAWFDIVMNELDGDWYEERNPINPAHKIDIPVYLQMN